MATTRQATRSKPAEPPKCPVCKGTGETTITVRVGRRRRDTGAQQLGLCLTCLGSGEAPAREE
ncbi:hypothetical protein ACFOSC_13790 [Streptantibioticus rubrisoli]|uniref:Molecular chaperone DnaJ n=1 Tax=Streptantibioticus rubrisoli TaxID=1387313 RepID=A0ABT1PFB2_9ACTN|nr:hypothetical protein [Streptantibioticus rubrisoli]MCQ4043005.1 hypothetical protein [Streptantibioticus rubrisoli]